MNASRGLEALSVKEVVQGSKGILISGSPDCIVTGVSTDTRTLMPGDLFFALKAQRDGHEFLQTAIEKGAGGLIISDEQAVPADCPVPVVKVEDPLWALGDLAGYYRSKFKVKVVAVTGSVGKTTTKEMLASILERKWRVLKNEMNYNNEIGVPLTIFNLDRNHEVLVIELAMRALSEIRRLASIVKPTVGVITNIGMSHIERLGSQGAIADAKSELLEELNPRGAAVLNYEDGYYMVMKDRFAGRVISFGSCKGASVIVAKIEPNGGGRYNFVLMKRGGAIEVKLPVLGHHNVFNALAASAAAIALGVDLGTIRDGLESFASPAMRMELQNLKSGCMVLNDAYNANPASMSAALRTLRALKGYKRKIAVLGDMFELGDYGPKAHKDIGRSLAGGGIDLLVTVGESGKFIAEGAREAGYPSESIISFTDSTEAGNGLKPLLCEGDAVLVKGSRGMRMENVLKVLDCD